MVIVVNLRHRHPGHVERVNRGTIFGNPVVLGKRCPECHAVHVRDPQMKALVCYGRYLIRRLESDTEFRRQVAGLARCERIGCHCAPAPCHGDLLALYVNGRIHHGHATAMLMLCERVEELSDNATRQGELF